MFNQELLKKITILYVEDDELIRNSTLSVFKKLFNEVYIAKDGQDGLLIYKGLVSKNIIIDVVITDINMPKMSGIEMLEKIRELDNHLPFVITSAHAEANHFLDAIKLNVMHYAIKPLQIKDLMLQIQDICHQKYQDLVIKNTHKENERYLDIINKVAIVSRTDIHGDITYANNIFCEVSGYTREELIGSNQRIVRHPDVAKPIFDNLWNTLRSGKIWRGKIKNKAKNGDTYIVNANIFPVLDETGEHTIEYMAVRFVITAEEDEKRVFHQNVIKNIKESKQNEQSLKSKIKELESKLKFSSSSDVAMFRDALFMEKDKLKKLRVQVSHYEEEAEHSKKRYGQLSLEKKEEISEYIKKNKKLTAIVDEQKEKSIPMQIEITDQRKEIIRLSDMVEEQSKMILDLKDVINHREAQLATK